MAMTFAEWNRLFFVRLRSEYENTPLRWNPLVKHHLFKIRVLWWCLFWVCSCFSAWLAWCCGLFTRPYGLWMGMRNWTLTHRCAKCRERIHWLMQVRWSQILGRGRCIERLLGLGGIDDWDWSRAGLSGWVCKTVLIEQGNVSWIPD